MLLILIAKYLANLEELFLSNSICLLPLPVEVVGSMNLRWYCGWSIHIAVILREIRVKYLTKFCNPCQKPLLSAVAHSEFKHWNILTPL